MNTICPYCAGQIATEAKICPHCRQWLKLYSFRNPVVFSTLLCVFALAWLVWFMVFIRCEFNQGIDFAPYRSKISVLESRMNLQPYDGSTCVFVVGVLTNKSDVAWKDIQMDLRFYNKSGTLIDATIYSRSGKIYPNGELAFRVRNLPIHDLSEYDNYKIYVSWARDARARF